MKIDNKIFQIVLKKLKLIKELWKEVATLKPDKGNSVVLITNSDYFTSSESLFADPNRFQKTEKDSMLTQLLEFQKYLKTLFNCGKTIADQFKKMCPQNAKVACVYAFTKVQKGYMCLPKFHPATDSHNTVVLL